MNRDIARPLVIALLCVLAISLAAATLDSTVAVEPSGGGGAGGQSDTRGAANASDDRFNIGLGLNQSNSQGGSSPFSFCYPILNHPLVLAGIVGVFLLGSAFLYRRIGIFGPVAFVGSLGIPVLLLHALLTAQCGSSPEESSNGGGFISVFTGNMSIPEGGGAGGAETGTGVAATDPPLLMAVVLGVAIVAAVALLFQSTGDDEVEQPEPAESAPDMDVAAVGRAAGAAATRIEDDADVTNEVYRAWREMTHHLEMDRPGSATPAEFAATAVDAGMDRADVSELTTLFEEVRYGGEMPTDEREARALSALRRIEDRYAEEDA